MRKKCLKLENNNVYLSFGRHGRYGSDTAIDRLSMLEAYLSGKEMAELYPACDTVYHSPIARAVQTAEFRALGMNCSHLIETPKLSEDSPAFDIKKFINNLLSQSKNERHYHFITHLPVVEKLGLGALGCGEIGVCKADSWQEMLAENFSLEIIENPEFEQCANLLQKMSLSAEDFNSATPEDIFLRLQR